MGNLMGNFWAVQLRTAQECGYVLGMKTTKAGAARALRSLRTFADLTLEEVATQAETSSSYLSNVETGRVMASPDYIFRISRAIGELMRSEGVDARGAPAAEAAEPPTPLRRSA